MKKFLFAFGFLGVLAATVFGQTTSPADSGSVSQPQSTSRDTSLFNPQMPEAPTDTESTVAQPPPSAPTDTAAAAPPPAETGAGIPQPTAPPADTGAVPMPADTGNVIPEAIPADTISSAMPSEKTTPADTTAIPAPQPVAPVQPEAEASPEEGEAKEKPVKKVAFGIVFNDEAPLSVRAWFNPKIGLDIGLGLRGRRVDDSSTISDSTPVPQTRVTLLDLSFDLGIPIRAIRKEKVDFILRPGFGVRARPNFEVSPVDPTIRSIETTIELEMNGSVGFEYYPFERVGFSLQTGMALILTRTGGDISNSVLHVQSFPAKKGVNFGFRYYLF